MLILDGQPSMVSEFAGLDALVAAEDTASVTFGVGVEGLCFVAVLVGVEPGGGICARAIFPEQSAAARTVAPQHHSRRRTIHPLRRDESTSAVTFGVTVSTDPS